MELTFSNFKIMTMNYFLILFLAFQAVFAQETNKMDAKGLKDGLWKGVYEPSKRPRYEGTFSHGKETGTFKFFDDTHAGTLIATREFNPKDNSCYTIFYNQKNNKVSEGKVVNKIYEGEWKYYHEDSPAIMTKETYKKGKLEGKRTVYFKDGKVAEEVNYSNDLREGVYKKLTEKGILLEETNYAKGQFHGQATFRDPENNIVAEGRFKEGKKVGIWKFYEMGKLVSEENMSKQKKSKPSKTKKM
jgi:antitoxin component YwqK of YwqJK toxin-antitoxin module